MDDQTRARLFAHPEYIPVRIGILPAAWMKYREQLDALVRRYEDILGPQPANRDYDAVWRATYAAGRHIDEWGCVWDNVCHGHEAIVTGHPVPARSDVHRLKAPAVDAGTPHGFMYLRLADLRGFEEIMIDFAEEPPELRMLIDVVLGYNLRQVDLQLARATPGGMMAFGDDLGTQKALPISPARWRKYLKPCYQALYGKCQAAGHPVYMHTDGCIWEIIPDLIECGVNVLNPQIRANGLDNLVRTCKGKVCVDLDLDRQLFPFTTPAQIDRHIGECVEALGSPEGGLWLKAEVDEGVPLANIDAICQALRRHRSHFAGSATA